MIEATSCGGVVIFRGKILLLYKNYKNKYEGPRCSCHSGAAFRCRRRRCYVATGNRSGCSCCNVSHRGILHRSTCRCYGILRSRSCRCACLCAIAARNHSKNNNQKKHQGDNHLFHEENILSIISVQFLLLYHRSCHLSISDSQTQALSNRIRYQRLQK